MTQTVIVFAIIAVCVLYIGKSLYGTLTGKKKSPCDGCNGCALKDKVNNCNKK